MRRVSIQRSEPRLEYPPHVLALRAGALKSLAVVLGCAVPLGAVGCERASSEQSSTTAALISTPHPAAGEPSSVQRHGAPLSGLPEARLADVLSEPQRYQGQSVRVSGVARRVCQRKGCWMELAAGSGSEAPACRVKFKDYAFFVPTDSAGAQATLEGEVRVDKVLPGRVKHLEEEGAVFSSKNADGSANEIQLLANGVELVR